ncbi:MAG: hypothetical protein IKM31_11165 [Oscillospiraceae bacterium]|nr:hypothetical protein [Oscillospiraceae bacterium]
MDEEKLTEEMPEKAAEKTAAEEPVKPKVEGVRPAEGMPLPEKGLAGMSLWERARLFADDPDGYRTARRRG